jgi:hypothetical protein
MANHDTQHSAGHSAEALPSYEDINTPVVVMVGVISALLTLLSMMFFQGLYYHWEDRFVNSPDAPRSHLNATIENQKSLLKGGDGRKSIEEAMQAVITKYQK